MTSSAKRALIAPMHNFNMATYGWSCYALAKISLLHYGTPFSLRRAQIWSSESASFTSNIFFENYGHWMLYQDVIVWDLYSQRQWWRYSTLWTCIFWGQKWLLHWFRFHSDPPSMPYICNAVWFVSLFLHVFSIRFLQEYIIIVHNKEGR